MHIHRKYINHQVIFSEELFITYSYERSTSLRKAPLPSSQPAYGLVITIFFDIYSPNDILHLWGVENFQFDITITKKFVWDLLWDTSKEENYHYIQYITISNITISIMYCISREEGWNHEVCSGLQIT